MSEGTQSPEGVGSGSVVSSPARRGRDLTLAEKLRFKADTLRGLIPQGPKKRLARAIGEVALLTTLPTVGAACSIREDPRLREPIRSVYHISGDREETEWEKQMAASLFARLMESPRQTTEFRFEKSGKDDNLVTNIDIESVSGLEKGESKGLPNEVAWLFAGIEGNWNQTFDHNPTSDDISKNIDFAKLTRAKQNFIYNNYLILQNPDDTWDFYHLFQSGFPVAKNISVDKMQRVKAIIGDFEDSNYEGRAKTILKIFANEELSSEAILGEIARFSKEKGYDKHKDTKDLFWNLVVWAIHGKRFSIKEIEEVIEIAQKSIVGNLEEGNNDPLDALKRKKVLLFAWKLVGEFGAGSEYGRADMGKIEQASKTLLPPYVWTLEEDADSDPYTVAQNLLALYKNYPHQSQEYYFTYVRHWNTLLEQRSAFLEEYKRLSGGKDFDSDMIPTEISEVFRQYGKTGWENILTFSWLDLGGVALNPSEIMRYTKLAQTLGYDADQVEKIAANVKDYYTANPQNTKPWWEVLEPAIYAGPHHDRFSDVDLATIMANRQSMSDLSWIGDKVIDALTDGGYDFTLPLPSDNLEKVKVLMATYNKDPKAIDSMKMAQLFGDLHSYPESFGDTDPRPLMVDALTSDAAIQLLADGGGYLPDRYWQAEMPAQLANSSRLTSLPPEELASFLPNVRSNGQREAQAWGDFMTFNIWTSTFLMIYEKKIAPLKTENPVEYRRLLSVDKDRLTRYAWVMGTFGKLDEEVAANPDLYLPIFENILAHPESSEVDWFALVEGLTAGLENPASNGSYQKLVYRIFRELTFSDKPHRLTSIAYLVKRYPQLFDTKDNNIKSMVETLAGFANPELRPPPDWSKEKEIVAYYIYDSEEVVSEGAPGILQYLQTKDGFRIVKHEKMERANNGKWQLEKDLGGGRKITAYVVTGSYADAAAFAGKPPHWVSALMHSYSLGKVMAGVTESGHDFSNSVVQFGSCNSIAEIVGYYLAGVRAHYISDNDMGQGWVNLVVGTATLNDLANGDISSWEAYAGQNSYNVDANGIAFPTGNRSQYIEYVGRADHGEKAKTASEKFLEEEAKTLARKGPSDPLALSRARQRDLLARAPIQQGSRR